MVTKIEILEAKVNTIFQYVGQSSNEGEGHFCRQVNMYEVVFGAEDNSKGIIKKDGQIKTEISKSVSEFVSLEANGPNCVNNAW